MGLFGTIKPGLRKAEAAILHIELLGTMAIKLLDGTSLTPTGAKTRGLLAILALSDRRPVTRKTLAHLLWSRRSDEQARASLRQEIHRLSEALSPLGTDVLDIQRHALALKPVLTTVDAERYLNATPSICLKLPETDAALLTDLDGVDPALDEWLVSQRNRLRQHLIAILEQAQATLPEPEQRIAAAHRILRLDRLNESAWKVLLRDLSRSGDTGAALLTAEQCLTTFRDALSTEPGPATMALIMELRSSGNPYFGKGADSGLGQIFGRPAGPNPDNAYNNVSNEALSRSARAVATVGFAPFQTGAISTGNAFLDNLQEETSIGLVRFEFLSIFPPSSRQGNGTASAAVTKTPGDYLVRMKMQSGSEANGKHEPIHRLVVRVTDERRDGIIVWAERFTLTAHNTDDIIAIVSSEIGWRIAMAEARNSANRGIEELTPTEAALRAFSLINRKDPDKFSLIEELLQSARHRDADHPFLLLISALFDLIRFREFCKTSETARTDAVAMAQQLVTAYPESLQGKILLARLLLDFPPERAAAHQLLSDIKSQSPANGTLLLLEAYAALIDNEPKAAAQALDTFRLHHPTHPFVELFDMEFVLILLLGGKAEAALERSSIALCATPTRSVMLALHLAVQVALHEQTGRDTSSELANVRAQLAKIEPSFSLSMIRNHYNFLPPGLLETLLEWLRAGGIPDTAPNLTDKNRQMLGETPATRYESASVAPSSSVS